MATRKSEKTEPAKDSGWKHVPGDLNLWEPKAKGDALVCLVTGVNPNGKFGLQVKAMTPDGVIYTLPSHKVLQGRLEAVPGGLKPMRTALRITYDGKVKGEKYPTPTEMYSVEYRALQADDLWDVATS
jgi:hypothetical protein